MKIRNIKNLPVFDRESAKVIGRVEKAVVGDDYRLAYLIIEMTEGEPGMVLRKDMDIGEASVTINSRQSIKSYVAGEELSIYQKKLGDTVFDQGGRELGTVSDFIFSRDNMKVWGVEISSGAIKDILQGREEVPLEQVSWRTAESAVLFDEGSNGDDY
ncbi:PRC-barrel domain-containing protein [Syntrophomonas curvata]